MAMRILHLPGCPHQKDDVVKALLQAFLYFKTQASQESLQTHPGNI